MGSVPLLCNICPKRPDFSDISHLLTHVGSKGHLSHYFKAQVRSRQEPAVREELDTYDRWYDQYQIEKLLSHRMVLKESKDTQSKPKAGRKIALATRSGTGQKKPQRAQPAPQRSPSKLHAEDYIDPQLSQLQAFSADSTATRLPSPKCDRDIPDIASMHRAHVPRMRQQEAITRSQDACQTPTLQLHPYHQREKACLDTDSDGDCEETPSQNPVQMNYPDPSIQPSLTRPHSSNQSSPDMNIEPPNSLKSPLMDYVALDLLGRSASDDNWSIFEETSLAQSPVLKGVQWPGMNIFDSASPEAQRKRNQKKNRSIMMQMELNSTAVEPLERIYWPEGGLKKERVITGNVESSPIKEPTPKPKRRRGPPIRQVLGNLNPNEPTLPKRYKTQKRSTRNTVSGDSDLGNLSKRGFAMLDPRAASAMRTTHSRLDLVDGDDVDWRLGVEDYGTGRKSDFVIFEDDMESKHGLPLSQGNSKATNYPFLQSMHDVSNTISSHGLPPHNFGAPFTATPPYSSSCTGFDQTSSMPIEPNGRTSRPSGIPFPVSTKDKENVPSFFDQQGHRGNEPTEAIRERKTQRYFSITDAHPPQFFDFLPSQMEFGGLADPRFFTNSLNPLNPSACFQQNKSLQPHNNSHAPVKTPVGRGPRSKIPSNPRS